MSYIRNQRKSVDQKIYIQSLRKNGWEHFYLDTSRAETRNMDYIRKEISQHWNIPSGELFLSMCRPDMSYVMTLAKFCKRKNLDMEKLSVRQFLNILLSDFSNGIVIATQKVHRLKF